jgi:hypothetical protein
LDIPVNLDRLLDAFDPAYVIWLRAVVEETSAAIRAANERD